MVKRHRLSVTGDWGGGYGTGAKKGYQKGKRRHRKMKEKKTSGWDNPRRGWRLGGGKAL